MVLGLCSFAFHSSFLDYEQSPAPQQSIKAEIVLKYLTVLRPRQCMENGLGLNLCFAIQPYSAVYLFSATSSNLGFHLHMHGLVHD